MAQYLQLNQTQAKDGHNNNTEVHKMTYGDSIAFAILGITVLIWVNLQMMGVI